MNSARLIYATGLIGLWILLCFWARRQERSHQRAQQITQDTPAASTHAKRLLIVYASQTDFAESLVQQTAATLNAGEVETLIAELGQLDLQRLTNISRILFIISTYGESDAPESAARFADSVMNTEGSPASSLLATTHYGILALGDKTYQDFCGFWRRMHRWLHAHGAQTLFDPIDVDKGDSAAFAQWQTQLGLLDAPAERSNWQTPSYQTWTLTQRTLMNAENRACPGRWATFWRPRLAEH